MTALLGEQPTSTLALTQVERLVHHYKVPVEDAPLIAINLYGISSDQPRHRARVSVRPERAAQVPWMMIVPLNATRSPFHLAGEELTLGGRPVGYVERIDADEAVGGYFHYEEHRKGTHGTSPRA